MTLHLPRKGMETSEVGLKLFLPLPLVDITSSPQGDGNSTTILSGEISTIVDITSSPQGDGNFFT